MNTTLTLPVSQREMSSDVEGMIRCFNAQFGNPRVVTNHSILRPDISGVAGLMIGEDPRELQPVLLAKGCLASRVEQVRLIAHEIEHARHAVTCGLYLQNSSLFEYCFPRIVCLCEFAELQGRVRRRVVELLRVDKSLLLESERPEHYSTPEEILSRLRTFQVYLLQADAARGTEQPHEFLEVFTANDLCWLDDDYLETRCRAVVLPESVTNDIRLTKPR